MSSVEVTSLSDAGIAEDFSFAEVTFTIPTGESMRCRFKPKTLDMIVVQLAQILTHMRNNTVSEEGYITPPITLASGATAAVPAEASHIILTIRGTNGVVFHFAVEPEVASRLRSDIQAAEASVGGQFSHTRQ
jgi:hypothetical protein